MVTRRRLEQELFRTPPPVRPPKRKVVTPRYEWRVYYRRRNWEATQSRTFQSRPFAARLTARLLSPQSSWQPITKLRVQRRVVGEWQDVPIRSVLEDKAVRP